MGAVICISVITIAVMILGILVFPKIKIGRVQMASYWVVALLGALALIAMGQITVNQIGNALLADSAINPLKILVLFNDDPVYISG